MLSKDEKVFNKVSIRVGLVFIKRVYNPLLSYVKTCKKAPKNVVNDLHDFLFTFRNITRKNDYFELSHYKTKNLIFNAIILESTNLVGEYSLMYGSRVYDVLTIIITKVIDKYNKIYCK